MKGIPPEIDSLLWAVAEDESSRAGDEFVARYPKYAGELARRRKMVQGLKGGRPAPAVVTRSRPAFRPAPTRTAVPRRTLAVVGALVLAAIAVASYTIVSIGTPPPAPTPDPKPTTVTQRPPENRVRPAPTPVPPVVDDPIPQDEEPVPPVNDATPPTPGTGEKPQSFRVKRADLEGALTMLGVEAGVKIVVAPGMAKRTIDADYQDRPLSEILNDLGRRFGFTPFDQGDGTIIIVPATESGEGSSADPNDHVPKSHAVERTP